MGIIDSLTVPDNLPTDFHPFVERCLEEIRRDDDGIEREVKKRTETPGHSKYEALSYAGCILDHLRKLKRLVPQALPDRFIDDWLSETSSRFQALGDLPLTAPEYRPTPVRGIDLSQPLAAAYADPQALTDLRNGFVSHWKQLYPALGIAPTGEDWLREAQLIVEIACADRYLDQLPGGGLGLSALSGLPFKPSRVERTEPPWHVPWSAGGRFDSLTVDERAEAVSDLVVDALVRAPERVSRKLLEDMERAVNGDAAAWERLRAACLLKAEPAEQRFTVTDSSLSPGLYQCPHDSSKKPIRLNTQDVAILCRWRKKQTSTIIGDRLGISQSRVLNRLSEIRQALCEECVENRSPGRIHGKS